MNSRSQELTRLVGPLLGGPLLFNVVLPAACFVLARRFAGDPQNRRWATYSWITGALILLISIPSTIILPITENAGFPVLDGLIQRVEIIIGPGPLIINPFWDLR